MDVDGTLLLSHDDVYVEANREALLEVYGIAPDGPDRPGDTALSHTRHALRLGGLDDVAIDARLDQWCEAMSAHYLRLLAHADTGHWQAAPDAAEVLASLERVALLTGNPQGLARARMERLGLAEFFPPGHGAFGCEREDRVELFELAREREGGWPARSTVAVGDTPVDVSTAHAAGVLSIAVTTGRYGPDDVADADLVISELRRLPGALGSLVAREG